MDNKLTMRQPCALKNKDNSLLGCIRKKIASRLREVIILLCLVLVLGSPVQDKYKCSRVSLANSHSDEKLTEASFV